MSQLEMFKGFLLGQTLKHHQGPDGTIPTGRLTQIPTLDMRIGMAMGFASVGARYRKKGRAIPESGEAQTCTLWGWGPWCSEEGLLTFADASEYIAYCREHENGYVAITDAADRFTWTPTSYVPTSYATSFYNNFSHQVSQSDDGSWATESTCTTEVPRPSYDTVSVYLTLQSASTLIPSGKYRWNITDAGWITYVRDFFNRGRQVRIFGLKNSQYALLETVYEDGYYAMKTFSVRDETATSARVLIGTSRSDSSTIPVGRTLTAHGAFTFERTHKYLRFNRTRAGNCLGNLNGRCFLYVGTGPARKRMRLAQGIIREGTVTSIDEVEELTASGQVYAERYGIVTGTGGVCFDPQTSRYEQVATWEYRDPTVAHNYSGTSIYGSYNVTLENGGNVTVSFYSGSAQVSKAGSTKIVYYYPAGVEF